jgi:Na+/H+-dicarboxylate symporter
MSTPVRILLALALGLGLGTWLKETDPAAAGRVLAFAEPIGGMWLDALRMTIVPLVLSLLVIGIASTADAARAGGIAARTVAYILVTLWLSSLAGWLLSELFWEIAPLPKAAGAALGKALGAHSGPVPPVPGIGEFLRGIVPPNIVKAAAEDQMLGIILFGGLFGFAAMKLDTGRRDRLVGAFDAIAEAMLVIIGWVLWVAPLGVLALAFSVGAKAGLAAAGALGHYVLTLSAIGAAVTLIVYPAAVLLGRVGLGPFARAVAPAQALAISTQSSLACLPIMLKGADAIGVPARVSALTMPMAAALMRTTGPAMNLGVALYVAHWLGVALGPAQIAAGIALGATTTLGAVSLPGQVSFLSSIAPIAIAMGVPVGPLLLLIAVEPIPDIFRTIGNVTNDVALARVIARLTGNAAAPGSFVGEMEALRAD